MLEGYRDTEWDPVHVGCLAQMDEGKTITSDVHGARECRLELTINVPVLSPSSNLVEAR